MYHGTTASLICPACGQPFLSMQHAMESITQCPHCAHTAPRAHFGTQAQVAGVAQVRRRVAQAPAEPSTAFPASHPTQAPAAQPPPSQPAPYFQGHAAPQPFHESAAASAPPPPPAVPHSVARPTLQPSQALLPVHTPPPPAEYMEVTGTAQASGGGRVMLGLGLLAACGIAGWFWWDHTHTVPPRSSDLAIPAASPAAPAVEVRKAQLPLPPPPAPVKLDLQDSQAYASDAKQLVTDFFAAATPEARAACVHDAAKHKVEIEALFGPAAAQKIELRQLSHLPVVVLALPGGRHVPLFKLITSQCSAGALLRLETGEDGKRRLFWPLLVETHEAKLGTYLQQPEAEAGWFYVAMRPSHGLDLAADQRSKYFTFDVQITAASEPHLIACVERDTPLGRFMDRESDWGRVYLARLLVRKLDIKADSPCMIIMDCEGAVER